jgi:hypothetical protein
MTNPAAIARTDASTVDTGDAPVIHPYCFDCGYNLQGLELPRACPECGRHCDPAVEIPQLRAWFARRKTAITWLFRKGPAPTGIWTALGDKRSLAIAKRRERFWLWLPALLTLVTVGVGSFVTVDYSLRMWYYEKTDLLRKPFGEEKFVGTAWLIGPGLFSPVWTGGVPNSWIMVRERHRTGVGWAAPSCLIYPHLISGGPPIVAILISFLPCKLLSRCAANLGTKVHRRPEIVRASKAAWSLMAGPLGASLWLWLLVIWICAGYELIGPIYLPSPHLRIIEILAWASLALWTVGAGASLVKLSWCDRARLVIANRFIGYAVGLPVLWVGPVLAAWAVARNF